MPRSARNFSANNWYHVFNRANGGERIFREKSDYAHFLALMRQASERVSVKFAAATLMPNHFHAVMNPGHADALSDWTHWLFTTHVRRHHAKNASYGRVWQGRFKAFVIEEDSHLITVMRYVERNALRAGLVKKAEDWLWGSLRWRSLNRGPLTLEDSPVPLPAQWIEYVNAPQTTEELRTLRECVNRQRPFGNPVWVERKARELGLESSLVPRGRPRQNR